MIGSKVPDVHFGFAETRRHVPANVVPPLQERARSSRPGTPLRILLDVFPNSRHGFSVSGAPTPRFYRDPCGRVKLEQGRRHVGPQSKPNFSLGKAHNRLIRIAFFFARAVDYWTRGSGTPSRAKACFCRTVGRASIWIVRRSPRGSATSLIVSVPS